jgi:hypothetical protein
VYQLFLDSHSCSCEDDHHQFTPEIPWIRRSPQFSNRKVEKSLAPQNGPQKNDPKGSSRSRSRTCIFFGENSNSIPNEVGWRLPITKSSNDPDHSWSLGDGANSPMMHFTTFVLGPDQVWVRKAGFFTYVVEWGWPIHYVPWLKLESIAMNCPYWAMVIRFDWVNRQLRFVGPSYTNSCTSARLY